MNRKSLGQLLVEIENNFVIDDYNTLEKKFIFMKYTKLAKYYFLIALTSMAIAVGLYYIAGMIPNVKIEIIENNLNISIEMFSQQNETLSFDATSIRQFLIQIFPNRLRPFILYFYWDIYNPEYINLNDFLKRTSAKICISNIKKMLIIPIVVIGYVGFDCLFTHLAIHITAQFGILSCKIREILDDCNNFRFNIKTLVFRHNKLIRQAECLEDNFNIMILQQLMGTTFHLCISGYNTLAGSVKQEGQTLLLFFFYAFNVLSTLFIYCYVGESLIQEVIEI
ncbi:odorant receptor 13a-like [Vespa mandarinia]|uniref:odorant receptor 13a-like n=1 Tax=Vespa mandarinia TaxID=7446 RepID=UPI00161ED8DE|nr:odorant receptor 13a-like [Vespa mandarinia]